MLHQKPLYSRLDRLAYRHSRRFSTEALLVHVKLHVYTVGKCRKAAFQNIENEKYSCDLIEWHPCEPSTQWPLIACIFLLFCIHSIKCTLILRLNGYIFCFKFHLESIYDLKFYLELILFLADVELFFAKIYALAGSLYPPTEKAKQNVFLTYF